LRREEFTATLALGPQAVRRHFSVFVRENALSRPRIGIIVSKKTAARAVDRNRIKRQERFMGNDLVILARRCPLREGWGVARVELTALFTQLAAQLSKRTG
jgi:ribonuclease P protein component